ncbi:MAG TPA: protein kinase [Pyrinomonadaceae bacterium]
MFKPDVMIGPYKLIRRIGKGSFGVVWLAEKRSALATTSVAIKIPTEDAIDLEAVRHEASVWVSASGHPNVLPIIDADVYDDHIVIVSEYASDGTLADWLQNRGGRVPVDEAVEMMLGILAGLQHLHKRGIIHRDLKPENILLQGETPRLADFGIARVLKATSNTAATSGTPFYMPPEAFDGKRGESTDIWSAGVILYQLVAGRLPFAGDSMTAIMGAIISKLPQPIPGCPPEIWTVIEKALEKDPAKRYASAAEMRNVLRQSVSLSSENQTRMLEPDFDISMHPTVKAARADTDEAIDKTMQLEHPTELAGRAATTQSRGKSRVLWFALAAVLGIALVGGGFYFYRGSSGGRQHSDVDAAQVLARKTDAWVDRIFSAQGANGGFHEISTNDDTSQVWSTAQCLAAVLATDKDMTPYADKIKRGLAFIEATRRSGPSPGWNYYGNSNPFTVTEIAGWVVLAEIAAVDSKSAFLNPQERDQLVGRITRDLDEIIVRQDKNGGWRPIRKDQPGFIRTYSSAIALWSVVEARRSPAASASIGSRYDDNIRRGINWLLLNYKTGPGWVPNPNRPGQTAHFDGLNAQILFILSRAETTDAFSYLKFEQAYTVAKKDLIADHDLVGRLVDNNSSVPDVDIRFTGSEFMAEGSTFLWFPWTLAELSQLTQDENLTQPDRTAAAELRSNILDRNYDRLDSYVETGGLMYMFAENLFCTSAYLRSASPK